MADFNSLLQACLGSFTKNRANTKTGADALKVGEDKRVPRSIADSTLAPGDTFRIPLTTGEEAKAFLAAPMTEGGAPVLRCFVEVKQNGVSRCLPLFLGTFTKSLRDSGTGQIHRAELVFKNSNDSLATCATQADAWRLLGGKTFKVTKATTVPIVRRDKDGRPYETKGDVLSFEEV